MDVIPSAPRRWQLHRHHFALLLFTFAVHGLLLFNDGVYYDGWQVRTFIEFGHTDRLQSWFFDSGVPHVYYLHRLLGALPGGVFVYKLIAFACIAWSGLLVYTLAHESGLVGRLEGLLIAVIALCYPAFQAAPEITILPFLICYALFLLAALLVMRAEAVTGRHRILLTLAALACFFVSFTIGSLLVFYVGCLWFLAASLMRRNTLGIGQFLREFAPRRLYYLLLPVVFWLAKKLFLPTTGSYAEYNEFNLTPYSLIYNFRTFLASSLYDQFNIVLSLPHNPVQWLLLLLAAQGIYLVLRLGKRALSEDAIRPAMRVWFSFALLLMAIVPYVLVGKSPDIAGFGTRHALLIGLPMAILFVSVVQSLFPNDYVQTARGISNGGWVFLTVFVLLFSTALVDSYLYWQVRWIKCRSAMQALQADPASGKFSTYWVDDQFKTGERDGWTTGEWPSLFKTIWRDETRVGIDISNNNLLRLLSRDPNVLDRVSRSRQNFSDWNPAGRQAELTIMPGSAATSKVRLVVYYNAYRLLRPGGMEGFLKQVATVSVRPVHKPVALPGVSTLK